ncbi:hypothetical protein RFI_31437, partial [Reticulomyxa filosa]
EKEKENNNNNNKDDNIIDNGNVVDFIKDGIMYSEIEASVLSPGHYFGETSLLNEKDKDKDETDKNNQSSLPRFVCKCDCVIFEMEKKNIDLFFEQVPQARQWFDIMLSRYNCDLNTILQIPKALRYFTMFLESEFSAENIHFYLAIREYKKSFTFLHQNTKIDMANIICNAFIADSADQQINISGRLKRNILRQVQDKNITENMFDDCLHCVITLIERDSFPRFKQSIMFQQFLSSVENFTVTTKHDWERKLGDENKVDIIRRTSTFDKLIQNNKILERALS